MKLTRDLYVPLIDLNKLTGKGGEGYDWRRIDKSTIFDLAFNPQEETYGYIDSSNDATQVNSYQPELPQEIILDSSNAIYSAMFDFAMSMPLGSDAVVPVLLAMPDETGKSARGFLWEEAIVSPQNLNTVDGILSFTLKLNGEMKQGTVANEGGVFTFAAN